MSAVDEEAGRPVSFGYKSMWIAVRAADPAVVADTLRLSGVRTVGWQAGISEVQQSEGPSAPVFLTPAVDGWVLGVAGASGIDDIDLALLSRKFGEAQRFGTHRVSEYHEWQRWTDGEPLRRYVYVGDQKEIELDDGEPAAAEASIARRSDLDGDWDELVFADEETVLAVAREWSIDPRSLASRGDLPGQGLLGYLPC